MSGTTRAPMPEVDRAAASRRAIEMRRGRARVKDGLRASGGHAALLRRTASSGAEETERSLRVTDFLLTLPNVGPKRLAQILEESGTSDRKRLGGLGPRQRELLVGAVEHELARSSGH